MICWSKFYLLIDLLIYLSDKYNFAFQLQQKSITTFHWSWAWYNFSHKRFELVMWTFSQRIQRYSWLIHDLLLTFSRLVTCSWLVHNLITICSWLIHGWPTTSVHFFNDLFMKCSLIVHVLYMNFAGLRMTCTLDWTRLKSKVFSLERF